MVARILLILALLLPFPALAQAPAGKTLEGSWAMEVGGTAIFRFDIAPAARKGEWRGTWNRPSSLASDGNRFARLKGPPEQVKSMAGIEVEDQVELSFNDPRPGAIPDIFRFRLLTPDTVELTYVGTDLAPYTLKRVASGAKIGPWDESKVYARPVPPKAPPEAPPAENVPAETFNLPPGR